jgi:hypothetical protein
MDVRVRVVKEPHPSAQIWHSKLGETLGHHLEPLSFAWTQERCRRGLEFNFDWIIEDWENYLRAFEKRLDNGDITNAYLNDLQQKYSLHDSSHEASSFPLTMSILHWVVAGREYEAANVEVAWSLLYECRSWLEKALNSLRDPNYAEPVYLQHKKIASSGGRAKGERTQPVRVEIIRLLRLHRPKNGWGSDAVAIETILPDLMIFLDSRKSIRQLKNTPANLKGNIRNWRKDDQFNESFLRAISGKAVE